MNGKNGVPAGSTERESASADSLYFLADWSGLLRMSKGKAGQ